MPSVCRILLRLCVVLGLSATAGALLAQPHAVDLRAGRDASLQSAVERVVADAGLLQEVAQGRLALALVDATDPSAPRLAMLNGDRMMYAASMPKVAILLGALAEAEAGRLPINDDDRWRDDQHDPLLEQRGRDARAAMGRRRSPPRDPAVARFALYERAGAGGFWVGKGYGPEPATRRDPLHNLSHGATAYQVARLYWMLASDQLLSPPMNLLMKQVLSNPGIHHKFVKGLESRPGVSIYRKSGTWKQFHADSALVETRDKRFILVGIAEHADGGEWLARLAAPLHDLVVTPARATTAASSH